MAYEKVFQGVA